MGEQNYEERRQYKRIRSHFILTYYDTAHPEQKFSASQLKNISQGGICLVTDTVFAPGTLLMIEIKSAFFASITRIQAEVLESHERAKDIIYDTRVKFKDLSEEAKDALEKMIEFFDNKETEYE